MRTAALRDRRVDDYRLKFNVILKDPDLAGERRHVFCFDREFAPILPRDHWSVRGSLTSCLSSCLPWRALSTYVRGHMVGTTGAYLFDSSSLSQASSSDLSSRLSQTSLLVRTPEAGFASAPTPPHLLRLCKRQRPPQMTTHTASVVP